MAELVNVDILTLKNVLQVIKEEQVIPLVVNTQIALGLNLQCRESFYSFRQLQQSNSIEDITKYSNNARNFVYHMSDALCLFKELLGELEDPCVYQLTTDYGGLRRARIYNASNELIAEVDSFSESAALSGAVLEMYLKQHSLY